MNQVALARAVGVSQGFLSAIEKGRRHPGGATVKRLAGALDLPPAVIIGSAAGHDNPQPLNAASR